DGFGTTSFNAGTNWPGAVAPVAGKNYMVANGLTLRTPNVADQTWIFAGQRLVFVDSQFWLKGANGVAQANYVFDGATVRNAEDAGLPITLAGNIQVFDSSVLFADNGTIVVAANVSGSARLTLDGNVTLIRQVQFNNASNTWTGDLTVNPTASLVVNGVLNTGAGSVYNLRPGASGVVNSISGTGTVGLAGTLNIDLSSVVLSSGATWSLVNASTVNYGPGFTVVDSAAAVGGFTPDAGAVGSRIWTSGDGNYQFDELSGLLSYSGDVAGYVAWAGSSGLTPGVNDGIDDNPDADPFDNLLEYQLGRSEEHTSELQS